jgi:hypothetical protein
MSSAKSYQSPPVQGLTLRLPFQLWQLIRDSARRNETTVTGEIILACRYWLWSQHRHATLVKYAHGLRDENLAKLELARRQLDLDELK